MNKTIYTWFLTCVEIIDGDHNLRIGKHHIIDYVRSDHFHEFNINIMNRANKIPSACVTFITATKLFRGTIEEYNKPKWVYHKRFNNITTQHHSRIN